MANTQTQTTCVARVIQPYLAWSVLNPGSHAPQRELQTIKGIPQVHLPDLLPSLNFTCASKAVVLLGMVCPQSWPLHVLAGTAAWAYPVFFQLQPVSSGLLTGEFPRSYAGSWKGCEATGPLTNPHLEYWSLQANDYPVESLHWPHLSNFKSLNFFCICHSISCT